LTRILLSTYDGSATNCNFVQYFVWFHTMNPQFNRPRLEFRLAESDNHTPAFLELRPRERGHCVFLDPSSRNLLGTILPHFGASSCANTIYWARIMPRIFWLYSAILC